MTLQDVPALRDRVRQRIIEERDRMRRAES
jgi:hypothetical protein